jgi:hypothetical protein
VQRPETPIARSTYLDEALAEAVSTWLWEHTYTRYDLDVHLLAKWERGEVRWPSAHYRAALRAVLGVATDRELGFCQPRRSTVTVTDVDRKNFLQLALGVGASVVTGASLTELVAVAAPTPVPSVVGWTQIEEIRAATRTFATCGARPLRATALARLGRAEDAARAVGEADEEFSRSNAANEVYVRYYDSAEHAGATGYALSALAVNGRFVSEAAARLSAAISSHDNGAARSRALCQVRLASLTMVTGDPIEAAATGAKALDSADNIRSRRMADELRTLHRAAQIHAAIPEVTDLRHRMSNVVWAT